MGGTPGKLKSIESDPFLQTKHPLANIDNHGLAEQQEQLPCNNQDKLLEAWDDCACCSPLEHLLFKAFHMPAPASMNMSSTCVINGLHWCTRSRHGKVWPTPHVSDHRVGVWYTDHICIPRVPNQPGLDPGPEGVDDLGANRLRLHILCKL